MSPQPPPPETFFVGYINRLPSGLRRFLPAVAAALLAVFAGLALAVSSTQDDPGGGSFRWDLGRVSIEGTLRARPYPTVTLAAPAGPLAAGQTVMLSGGGKRGVQDRAEPLDGRAVRAEGILLTRGDLVMLQLRGGEAGLTPAEVAAEPPEDQDLGRWRVTGEICDGKCLSGAMRPGRGLAHKACANLCLVGGVPPVVALAGPVEGHAFLMLGGADGAPPAPWFLDRVGELVEIEGRVRLRGDLPILEADPDSVRRAR